MDSFKTGKWLVLFSALVGVVLLGMFGAAAQTSPPIFATNTPHSTTVNPTRPANASTPAPNTTTSETGITRIFYALGRANIRECTRLDCAVLGQLAAGEAVSVIGESTGETASSGNTLWYQVEYQGREAYIYGDLLSANPVTSSFSSRRSLLTCNQQDNLSCSDFANIAQAQMHLNTCGDEDNLDTDHDGFACEASQS